MALHLYAEANSMGLTFERVDEDKLQWLTDVIGHSKATSPINSTYALWIVTLTKARGVVVGSS